MSSDHGMTPQFFSVDDLADRYGVSPATVHQWLYKGTAPRSLKIGKYRRFRLADVLSWEESLASAPQGEDK
jgi:predicted DNA-binding transcriptional regulator AlpA